MKISDFKVGKVAYYQSRVARMQQIEPKEVEVTKVGRKYVYVKDKYTTHEFQLGLPTDMCLFDGFGGRLYLRLEDYLSQKELNLLRQEVQEKTKWARIEKYTLDQLRAINKILDGG